MLASSGSQQEKRNGLPSEAEMRQANINPRTGLATDYLNHFNEVMMLIEILPIDESVMTDLLAWEPLSYTEHFARSSFTHKDMAIRTYEALPHVARAEFETAVGLMHGTLQDAISDLEKTSHEKLEDTVGHLIPLLQEEISTLASLISGADVHLSLEHDDHDAQSAIDALMAAG